MEFLRNFIGYKGRKKYPDNASVVATGNVSNITYINYAGGSDTGSTGTTTDAYTKAETNALLAAKQDTLVSGENIATINGNSLLEGGDITVGGTDLTILPMGEDLFYTGSYPNLNVGIGEFPVAEVNDGTESIYLASLDREWYKIDLYKEPAHANSDKYVTTGLPQNLIIRFENYDMRMWDNPKYRLCLMEWRRDTQKRWHWSVPMICPRWDSYTGEIIHTGTTTIYEFNETYTPIGHYRDTPGQIKMYDHIVDKTWADILPIETKQELMNDGISYRYRFKNGHSNKLFGFAIFKYFPTKDIAGFVQGYQWARVSNIAKLRLTVDKNGYVRARVLP
jgi:hypothetical protein